jgi:hypothetical protein
MIEPAHYAFQVGAIAQMMLQAWDGDDPLIRADLPGFVDLYIGWCRDKGGKRASEPVEEWTPDALYTRMFFDELLNRFRKP